jgi:hypothetical protein
MRVSGKEDAMALVQRVQNICLKPNQEWEVIAGESTPTADLLKNYALPLAGAKAVAEFIGNSFVRPVGFSIASLLVAGVVMLGISVGATYAVALIIDALAPKFGAEKGVAQGLKVAVYSATPVWVVGILGIIPSLGALVWLAMLYSLYLLYLGLQRLMKCPAEKALAYTAAVAGCWLGIMIVASMVVGGIAAAGMVASGTLPLR